MKNLSPRLLEALARVYAKFSAAALPPGKRVPTGKALRDPEDPVQAERIQRAATRRELRGRKRLRAYHKQEGCKNG